MSSNASLASFAIPLLPPLEKPAMVPAVCVPCPAAVSLVSLLKYAERKEDTIKSEAVRKWCISKVDNVEADQEKCCKVQTATMRSCSKASLRMCFGAQDLTK